ncbi:hypothetical protein EASAB2608_03515 [Streptomyces sp. EAS-AB2608]|nr:hypothetical protein EASAB2608_03515 [Streptomyces sp. EAS-AB2608]
MKTGPPLGLDSIQGGPVAESLVRIPVPVGPGSSACSDAGKLVCFLSRWNFVRLDSQRSAFDRVGDALTGDGNGPADVDGTAGVP